MGNYNKVILMGNLTRKPELTYTQSGTPICKFGLAVNRRFRDSQTEQWREEPTFIDITMFGKRGEAFARYHDKGRPAFVEGSLRLDTWQDKESGAKRSKLYVVADNWEFCGSAREGGGPPPEAAPAGAGGYGGYGGEGGGGSEPDILDVNDSDTPF